MARWISDDARQEIGTVMGLWRELTRGGMTLNWHHAESPVEEFTVIRNTDHERLVHAFVELDDEWNDPTSGRTAGTQISDEEEQAVEAMMNLWQGIADARHWGALTLNWHETPLEQFTVVRGIDYVSLVRAFMTLENAWNPREAD